MCVCAVVAHARVCVRVCAASAATDRLTDSGAPMQLFTFEQFPKPNPLKPGVNVIQSAVTVDFQQLQILLSSVERASEREK